MSVAETFILEKLEGLRYDSGILVCNGYDFVGLPAKSIIYITKEGCIWLV